MDDKVYNIYEELMRRFKDIRLIFIALFFLAFAFYGLMVYFGNNLQIDLALILAHFIF
jgi:hypothetical protein